MNKNYIKGRAFEYKVLKRWNQGNLKAARTAGSHSPFDVIAYMEHWTAEDLYDLKPGSTLERTAKYEYRTYITPIIGYGVQCKVRKRGKKSGKV